MSVEIYKSPLLDDANLQAYYRLEADGTDDSPNGYDLTGTAPDYVSAKFGNGGDFEATSSNYLSIANASCPNLEISGSQSWGCWIKPETLPASAMRVMAKKINERGIYINSGVPTFQIIGLTTNTAVASSESLSTGLWYFVVGVYDSSNSKLKIWVNGTKTEVTASGSSTASTEIL